MNHLTDLAKNHGMFNPSTENQHGYQAKPRAKAAKSRRKGVKSRRNTVKSPGQNLKSRGKKIPTPVQRMVAIKIKAMNVTAEMREKKSESPITINTSDETPLLSEDSALFHDDIMPNDDTLDDYETCNQGSTLKTPVRHPSPVCVETCTPEGNTPGNDSITLHSAEKSAATPEFADVVSLLSEPIWSPERENIEPLNLANNVSSATPMVSANSTKRQTRADTKRKVNPLLSSVRDLYGSGNFVPHQGRIEMEIDMKELIRAVLPNIDQSYVSIQTEKLHRTRNMQRSPKGYFARIGDRYDYSDPTTYRSRVPMFSKSKHYLGEMRFGRPDKVRRFYSRHYAAEHAFLFCLLMDERHCDSLIAFASWVRESRNNIADSVHFVLLPREQDLYFDMTWYQNTTYIMVGDDTFSVLNC